MTNLIDLTTSQLNSIIAIKEQIEALQGQIDSIVAGDGGGDSPAPTIVTKPHRRRSAAVRARMAAAARARWAKIKGTGATDAKPPKKGKRRLSAAGRAAIIAATKARWARVKGTPSKPNAAKKRDRRSSPAVKAKLAAAARARWAKVRAAGKTRL
jgi:hypothetical protein